MTYNLDIQIDYDLLPDQKKLLNEGVNKILPALNINPGSLTILFSGDDLVHQLNFEYRNIDKTTDVLSFPAGDPIPGGEEMLDYLGDIIISVPTADKQAKAGGHTLVAELLLLVTHGVLHLLGYDHETTSDKEEMWLKQEDVLDHVGLKHIVPTEF